MRTRSAVMVAALAGLAGCSIEPVDPVGTTVMQTIGTGGGTVSTPAGASIVIPPGALAKDTVISITATATVPPSTFGTAVGTNYQFGPSGTMFLKPVTMNLPFSRSKLPAGVDPMTGLQILTAPDGSSQYTSLGPAKLLDANHAGATTLHFSMCVVSTNPAPDSSGNMPGQCTLSCSGGGGGGGVVDAGTTGGGGGSGGTPADMAISGGGSGSGTDDMGPPNGGGGTGSTATCGCQEACNNTSYQLVCDGTNCSCIQNGTVTKMVSQGAQCSDTYTLWTGTCGFPASSSTGGNIDGGTTGGGGGTADASIGPPPDFGGTGGGSCTHSCGGGPVDGGTGCSCMSSCNGHTYQLSCLNVACSCVVDGTPQKSFTSATGTCSQSDWTGSCAFP